MLRPPSKPDRTAPHGALQFQDWADRDRSHCRSTSAHLKSRGALEKYQAAVARIEVNRARPFGRSGSIHMVGSNGDGREGAKLTCRVGEQHCRRDRVGESTQADTQRERVLKAATDIFSRRGNIPLSAGGDGSHGWTNPTS